MIAFETLHILYLMASTPFFFSIGSMALQYPPIHANPRTNNVLAFVMRYPSSSPLLFKRRPNGIVLSMSTSSTNNDRNEKLAYLKRELATYIAKRKELGLNVVEENDDSDDGSDRKPLIFDYMELDKYGYGNLINDIMDVGGRFEMYDLMDMAQPKLNDDSYGKSSSTSTTMAWKDGEFVGPSSIDMTGETDKSRYQGLKMTQALDDDAIGKALEETQRKIKEGERLRPKLREEDYVYKQPSSAKSYRPDFTPDSLDKSLKVKAKTYEWIRESKESKKIGKPLVDPNETLVLDGSLRFYNILTLLLVAVAFGRSSTTALTMLGMGDGVEGVLDTLQGPALALSLASIGSCLVSGIILAPSKNRNSFVWAIKGLFGGPLTLLKLRNLDELAKEQN